ncbi:MFS transporter, partial [Escherichia coli]|nr:MFS transporter [Escherichia coli]
SLWWGVFSVITFLLVKSRSPKKGNIRKRELVKIGFRELWLTLRELYGLKYTSMFLLAYLFYNDGIQTVILNSSVFL